MKTLKFTKMHGLGNDFMVVNGIGQDFDPLTAPLAEWSDRFRGVGFDQLLLVEKPSSDAVDFRYRIFNSDGSEVEQCGNGARCFARFVADKGLTNKKEILVETAKGVIIPKLLDNGLVTVNMGKPRFTSSEIPFVPVPDEAEDALTHMVMVGLETVQVSCVNMGNPHAVIVVEDVQTAPVAHWGEAIESHEQFPERVNVGFMQIVDRESIRLRGFERGVGGGGVSAYGMRGRAWHGRHRTAPPVCLMTGKSAAPSFAIAQPAGVKQCCTTARDALLQVQTAITSSQVTITAR